ncbi:hypothetical protein DYB37_009863 [Aphanomyces astaci]|uniref:Uncharacterized protein n=1 Tax=Aphanomyces astaci TaxID=112090 RepID=A0A418E9R3_APHAT|nr:hypothetical protein DYB35_009214 [Aphanomyces astaci]RHZ09120.1 hypothetical protein DYB37_009863 [Aphanomyces astaci]
MKPCTYTLDTCQAFHRLIPLPALSSGITRLLCDEDLQVPDDDVDCTSSTAATPSMKKRTSHVETMRQLREPVGIDCMLVLVLMQSALEFVGPQGLRSDTSWFQMECEEQHDTQDIDMKVMELVDVIGTRMRRQLKPMMQASSVGGCSCSEDVAALQSTVAIMQEQIKLLMQERTAKTPSSVDSASSSSSSAVVNALSDRVSTLEGRQSAFQSQMAQLCKSLGTNATGKPGGIALPKPLLQELRDEFDQKLAASTVKLETAMNKQMSSAIMSSMQYDDILSLVASETDMGVQNTKQWFEDRCAQEAKHRMGLEARVMGQFDAHAEWLQQLEGLCDTWHASQTHVDALAVKQMMQDTKDVMESVALMESRVLQAGNTGDESKKKVAGLQKLIEKIMRDQGSVESMLQQYVRQYVSVRIRDNNRLLDATLRARIPAYVENEHESFMLVRPNSKQPGGTTKPELDVEEAVVLRDVGSSTDSLLQSVLKLELEQT